MRVGIVSQWYAPEPALIPVGLAHELAARGHRVRVLTGFPNYPGGRLYPGYRQAWGTTGRDHGVTVRRVPLYPSHSRSATGRAANYLSFAATSALAAGGYLAGADVLYVYHPPATAFAAAALLRLVDRVPVVLHVQDVWPESVSAAPMAPRGAAGAALHQALAWAMRRIYRAAAGIAVIAPSMRDLVVRRGADAARVRTVLNWTDEELFRPVPATDAARRELGHRGRRIVMYAGNIGPYQNVDGAVRAAAAVRSRAPVDVVVVGTGIAEGAARDLARQLGADNVRFLGPRPLAAMPALYGAADFQLVSLRDLPIFRGTIPSKLQAAMSCGSPVLVAAPGDAAHLVRRQKAGLTCPPEDADALGRRLVEAAALPDTERAAMGARARDGYLSQMSRARGVDELEDMLARAAAGRRRRLPGGLP